MKFEIPDNCGMCSSMKQLGENYICNMPETKEVIEAGVLKVSLDSRPDWCPKKKVVDAVDSLSEEDKELFDNICEGFSALFELMDNTRR